MFNLEIAVLVGIITHTLFLLVYQARMYLVMYIHAWSSTHALRISRRYFGGLYILLCLGEPLHFHVGKISWLTCVFRRPFAHLNRKYWSTMALMVLFQVSTNFRISLTHCSQWILIMLNYALHWNTVISTPHLSQSLVLFGAHIYLR
jgi:hypothetical protein